MSADIYGLFTDDAVESDLETATREQQFWDVYTQTFTQLGAGLGGEEGAAFLGTSAAMDSPFHDVTEEQEEWREDAVETLENQPGLFEQIGGVFGDVLGGIGGALGEGVGAAFEGILDELGPWLLLLGGGAVVLFVLDVNVGGASS